MLPGVRQSVVLTPSYPPADCGDKLMLMARIPSLLVTRVLHLQAFATYGIDGVLLVSLNDADLEVC